MRSLVFGLAALFLACTPAIPAAAAKAKVAESTFQARETLNITDVVLDSAEDVFVNDEDRVAIVGKIKSRLDQRVPGPAATAPAYKMLVLITRYKRGSAAARMSLIGLGSIKIEGTVKLIDANGAPAGEYAIHKGLVLGGIAGGMATAGGVHGRFANAVVAPTFAKPVAANKAK